MKQVYEPWGIAFVYTDLGHMYVHLCESATYCYAHSNSYCVLTIKGKATYKTNLFSLGIFRFYQAIAEKKMMECDRREEKRRKLGPDLIRCLVLKCISFIKYQMTSLNDTDGKHAAHLTPGRMTGQCSRGSEIPFKPKSYVIFPPTDGSWDWKVPLFSIAISKIEFIFTQTRMHTHTYTHNYNNGAIMRPSTPALSVASGEYVVCARFIQASPLREKSTLEAPNMMLSLE